MQQSKLKQAISALVQQQRSLSEYKLLTALQSPPYQLMSADALRDTLSLFRCHFVVFHHLYTLRDEWRLSQVGELHIHTTEIRLAPWCAGTPGLDSACPLRDYYLDWQNLRQTGQQQVEELLDSFWLQMAGLPAQRDASAIAAACATLELSTPFNRHSLKRQYRKLLHQHHPDKGGSNAITRDIQQAYQLLSYELACQ